MPNFPRPAHRDVLPLSDAALAALLAGTDPAEEPTPGLRQVADVLAALRAGPTNDELAGAAGALAEFRRGTGVDVAFRGSRRPRALPSLLGARAAVAALVVMLGLGGLAGAAYARVLPAPMQRLAHDTIDAPAAPGSSHAGAHLARKRTQPGPSSVGSPPSHRPGGKRVPPGRQGKRVPPGRVGIQVPPGRQGTGVPPGRKDKGVPPAHRSGHHASHPKGKSSAHNTGNQGSHDAARQAGASAQQNPARHRAVTSRS